MASLETRPHPTGATFRVVWREDGKRQQLTLPTRDQADRFRQLVEGSGNRWPAGWDRPRKAAPPVPTGKLTFGTWARRAIANRSRASERTKVDYLRDLDKHFLELLDVPLDEIGDDDVTAWTEARVAAKLADKTIRNQHGFASSLFVDALNQHPP